MSDLVMPRITRVPRKLSNPPRKIEDVTNVVIHCTGRGVYKGGQDEQVASANAVKYYGGSNIGPHFMIDTFGKCFQFVDINKTAWHINYGSEGWALYQSENWYKWYWPVNGKKTKAGPKVFEWWKERWIGINNPLELWRPKVSGGGEPNYRTIGIEMIPKPNLKYTDDQYRMLGDLLPWLLTQMGVRIRHPNQLSRIVLGHEDLHPVIRTNVNSGGIGWGWDPGPLEWNIVLFNLGVDLEAIRNGELEVSGELDEHNDEDYEDSGYQDSEGQ